MKVDFINCPVISKQIKLTRKESLQVGQLLNKYHKGKTENVLEQLKDIFSPYIEKKFENTITDREYSKKDYMQELYLQLFESFSKSKKKNSIQFHIL